MLLHLQKRFLLAIGSLPHQRCASGEAKGRRCLIEGAFNGIIAPFASKDACEVPAKDAMSLRNDILLL
jgi:hypothetical protein